MMQPLLMTLREELFQMDSELRLLRDLQSRRIGCQEVWRSKYVENEALKKQIAVLQIDLRAGFHGGKT